MLLENLGRGAIGMLFLIMVCYALSNNRKAIDWKLVIIGVIVQICFALGVLRVNFVKVIFGWLSGKFVEVINIGHKGIEFIFGNLADASQGWGYVFAVQVLPNIIFFSAKRSPFQKNRFPIFRKCFRHSESVVKIPFLLFDISNSFLSLHLGQIRT